MTERYAVGIVVDPAYGDRLLSIAEHMPVWIVDTPVNRPAVERHWARHQDQGQEGVTTFKADPRASREEWCEEVLGDVDLHHGVFSHDPPYSVLEVFGTAATPSLRLTLTQLGFDAVTERTDGFRAESARAAA